MIARDDILFVFSDRKTGAKLDYIRVASRHGEQSMPALLEILRGHVRPEVEVTAEIETPSRFTPTSGRGLGGPPISSS